MIRTRDSWQQKLIQDEDDVNEESTGNLKYEATVHPYA